MKGGDHHPRKAHRCPPEHRIDMLFTPFATSRRNLENTGKLDTTGNASIALHCRYPDRPFRRVG